MTRQTNEAGCVKVKGAEYVKHGTDELTIIFMLTSRLTLSINTSLSGKGDC